MTSIFIQWYQMTDYKNIMNTLSNNVNTENFKMVGLYSGSFFLLLATLNCLKFCFQYLPNSIFYFLLSYLTIRVYETMNDNSINDKFNNLVFTCSYDIIVLYSKIQILSTKFYNICNKQLLFTKEYLKINVNYEERVKDVIYKLFNLQTISIKANKYLFEYIKNGFIVDMTVSLNKNLINPEVYDFIVLSNESTKNKKIIQKEDVINLNDNVDLVLDSIEMISSNVKFLVVQLFIPYLNKGDETLLDLHFSTVDYNFLMDGNRIDKQFLLYFVNNYYSCEKMNINHLDGCEIRFIDGSVNMNNVNLDTHYIHIYENSYEIKNVDTLDVKNNFIESDSEYEVTNEFVRHTNTEESSESSISDTNSD